MLLNEESNKLTVGVSVEHEIFQDAMSGTTLVSSAAEERTFFRTTSLNLHYYLSSRLSVTFHPKLFRAWRHYFAQPFTAKRAEI